VEVTCICFFFFQAEDGIRDLTVTGVQTCALPILRLECKALVNYRDYHSTTHAGNWQMHLENIAHGIKVTAFDGATPFYLFSYGASVELRHDWHRDCFLPLEQYRGLDSSEDHLLSGI